MADEPTRDDLLAALEQLQQAREERLVEAEQKLLDLLEKLRGRQDEELPELRRRALRLLGRIDQARARAEEVDDQARDQIDRSESVASESSRERLIDAYGELPPKEEFGEQVARRIEVDLKPVGETRSITPVTLGQACLTCLVIATLLAAGFWALESLFR